VGLWLARSIVESCGGAVRRLEEDRPGTTIELVFRGASPELELSED
jgi:hypothetical protein